MADAPPRINPGAYWGTIQAGAGARIGTVALQRAIHVAYFLDTGVQGVIDQAQFRNLYSTAIGNRAAAESFAAAPQGAAVGPEHIGRIPNAPPASPLGTSRRYVAYFEQTVERAGQRFTETRASVFSYGLPPTKQAVLNQLNRDASRLSDDYEDELHVGIGNVSLLAA